MHKRDLSTGRFRYHWPETGAQDLYRHAHAFDHLASFYSVPQVIIL